MEEPAAGRSIVRPDEVWNSSNFLDKFLAGARILHPLPTPAAACEWSMTQQSQHASRRNN